MTLFELAATVSSEDVDRIVRSHWNIKLGAIIRTSQNHTFHGSHIDTGVKYAVRVTPDPTNKHHERMTNEVHFVNFVAQYPSVHHVCCSVASLHGDNLVRDGILTIMVIRWAEGAPNSFMSYRWMHDEQFVCAWGKWIGEFHKASKEYSEIYPDKVCAMQRWDEVHEGLLEGFTLHPDDLSAVNDCEQYDIIMSNFYFTDETQGMSVFDWTEAQQGFYLMDIAQAAFGVFMLKEGGAFDGGSAPEYETETFLNWMIKGYESVYTAGYVDRVRLDRMIDMRRSFYERFGRRALQEGNIPEDMEWFVKYVNRWFDRVRGEQSS